MLTGTHPRDVLEVLQGMSDDVPASPRLGIGEWYRPHLGTFVGVDRDGFLCRAGNGNEKEFNGPRSPVIPTDSLMDRHLMMGASFSNPEKETDSRQHTGQSPQTTGGLVSPFPRCCRSKHHLVEGSGIIHFTTTF